MWRGYILPRQEKTYGKWAWLVNGLLWAYLFHFFVPWNFLSFWPSMLITPFIAQRTKNTWVALLVHGMPNIILLMGIFLTGVLGIG
jgi:membrane protease YdiL (CAAX protease family)